MRRMDFYTGLVTAVVGAAASWEARDLEMFGDYNAPGPGFFPKILAGLLVGLGLLRAAMSVRAKAQEPGDDGEVDGERSGPRAMVRPVAVLVVFAVIAP